MAQVRFAAMVGVAAFSAGIALTAPLPAAVAHADGRDTSSASDAGTRDDSDAGAPALPARRSPVGHTTAPKPPAARGGGDTPPDPAPVGAPRNRGSGRTVAAMTDVMAPVPTNDRPPAPTPGPAAGTDPAVSPVTRLVAPAPAAPPNPGPTAITDTATIHPTTPPSPVLMPAAPAAPQTPYAHPSRSAPRALAVMTVTSGVTAHASASATLIDNLLAPIRTIFGEGTALLVRRTFFNQAPTVTPVQLTGQSEGPITGTLGAVDPDGDALKYSVTASPRYGAAVVNADGSYTYTPATDFTGNDSFVVAVTDTGFHINLLDLFRPASTSASVAVGQGALASKLRFQFVYGAGSQYWSSAARSALESAATQLSSYIVVTSPVTITYDVTGELSPFSSTLASAGSDFINDGSGFLQTVVQSKIQTGYDANGSAADGTIDWNFGPAWALGSSVSSTEYDFTSTAMHELLHTFGFLSNINQAGSNTGRIWTLFDSYVVNSSGARAINSNFSWNTAFNPNLTGGNGGLYFNGAGAVAANYGTPVALYTPSSWAPGSSMSHISAGTLMNANVSKGLRPRVLSPTELGILADIGYTVTGTGTPVVLFVAFAGLRPRRRKGSAE